MRGCGPLPLPGGEGRGEGGGGTDPPLRRGADAIHRVPTALDSRESGKPGSPPAREIPAKAGMTNPGYFHANDGRWAGE